MHKQSRGGISNHVAGGGGGGEGDGQCSCHSNLALCVGWWHRQHGGTTYAPTANNPYIYIGTCMYGRFSI